MPEALLNIIVSSEMEAIRIDKFLSLNPEIKTRSRAEYLIQNSLVKVNGHIIKPSYKVKANDHIQVDIPLASPSSSLEKLDIALDIVYEDKDLLVVNKPSGLVVHPAAGHQNDTLVNALLHHTKNLSMKFGEDRPGIVHRIDKETSGLLVVAKNDESHTHLSEQFKNRTITRFYEAIVTGKINPAQGKIISYLARKENERKKYASLRDHKNHIIDNVDLGFDKGKLAITNYQTLAQAGNLSLVKLKLETGRTHQIRVHLSEKGHPIIGDYTYGAKAKEKNLHPNLVEQIKNSKRFFLHAKTLGFIHPITKENLLFEVDWPEAEKKLINLWKLYA
ncbi:MAG: RluA family pseudouridine synthase [Bdellovibrionaceae bacterium]|nr:RluA family pseudouridine synthase [Pseudobdellovibrionaceae bacterium]